MVHNAQPLLVLYLLYHSVQETIFGFGVVQGLARAYSLIVIIYNNKQTMAIRFYFAELPPNLKQL